MVEVDIHCNVIKCRRPLSIEQQVRSFFSWSHHTICGLNYNSLSFVGLRYILFTYLYKKDHCLYCCHMYLIHHNV